MVPMGGVKWTLTWSLSTARTVVFWRLLEPVGWQISERAALWAWATAAGNRLAPPCLMDSTLSWTTAQPSPGSGSRVLSWLGSKCFAFGVHLLSSWLWVIECLLGYLGAQSWGCWLEATACKLRAMYRVQVGVGGGGGQAQPAPGSTVPGGTLGTFLRELPLQLAWFVLLIKCHGQFVFRRSVEVIYPPNPFGRDCRLPRPQPHPGNTSASSLAFISWPVSLISEFLFWWYESSFALFDHVRCACKVGKTSTVFLWWNQSSDFLIMDLDYEFYK